MLGLITDRTQRNVYRRKELTAKGWAGMTTEERAEWTGNPFDATGANLFAPGPYYSDSVDLKYWNREIVATSKWDGVYIYAISIVGRASDFANKVLTLSAETITASSQATPKIEMFWHDGAGYDYAGGSLLSAGSVTFDTTAFPNTNNREYLAAYIYVTAHTSISAGEIVRFGLVMLEHGDVKHNFVPYTEILPTVATKGAYNYSDLNRVERAVAEISDRMSLGLVTKTDWTMWDIPTSLDMSRYLDNIAVIRSHFANTVNMPEAPTTMNNFTYEHANNIELILSAAYGSLAK